MSCLKYVVCTTTEDVSFGNSEKARQSISKIVVLQFLLETGMMLRNKENCSIKSFM